MNQIPLALQAPVFDMKVLMVNTLILILGGFLFISANSNADPVNVTDSNHDLGARVHFDDAYRMERLDKKSEYVQLCYAQDGFSRLSIDDQVSCVNQAKARWNEDYPDRGTHRYNQKRYGSLSAIEAREIRSSHLKKMKTVSFVPKPGKSEVELLYSHLESEVAFIERYVLKITPKWYREIK